MSFVSVLPDDVDDISRRVSTEIASSDIELVYRIHVALPIAFL